MKMNRILVLLLLFWGTRAEWDVTSYKGLVKGCKCRPEEVKEVKKVWRFEDTFGVEIDTVLQICSCVLVIVMIVCGELWSTVSWFLQLKRAFIICLFVSFIWNWIYLYKAAYAEHQANMIKLDGVAKRCANADFMSTLKDWFRSTWTLQDDPCKKYHEVLIINPVLLVPPTKAISVTFVTFVTEPLKHFGHGIGEFIKALLKDLPITLQVPVWGTILVAAAGFMYGISSAAAGHLSHFAQPHTTHTTHEDRRWKHFWKCGLDFRGYLNRVAEFPAAERE
uniref:Protein ORF112 n=1 Tax=Anguillid herpesvirus 1 TaxID=150286 RepID=A0A8E5EU50_9VIRU|nr:protein ORF112 [Anguillid herpesvirus 1]